MADAAGIKDIAQGFVNEVQHARLTYDFAEDGGAQGTFSLANLGSKALVIQAIVHVETACTSGGAAVVTIGSSSGDPDAFMAAGNGAVASLVDDYTNIETTAAGLVVASSETIDLVIATADLTAGKINVELQYLLVD